MGTFSATHWIVVLGLVIVVVVVVAAVVKAGSKDKAPKV